MKNTPKQVFEYLKSMEESHREFVLSRMEADQLGQTVKPLEGGGCTSTNCTGHTGCSPGDLVNYYCACHNGVCVAVPAT
jgi:hypothetical protein